MANPPELKSKSVISLDTVWCVSEGYVMVYVVLCYVMKWYIVFYTTAQLRYTVIMLLYTTLRYIMVICHFELKYSHVVNIMFPVVFIKQFKDNKVSL